MRNGARWNRGKVALVAAVAAAVNSGGAASWWVLADYKIELKQGVFCTVAKDAWPSSEEVLRRGLPSEADACKALNEQVAACGTVDAGVVQRCRSLAPGAINALEEAGRRVVAVPFTGDHRALRPSAWPLWLYQVMDLKSHSLKRCDQETNRVSDVFVLVGGAGTCLGTLVDSKSLVTAAHCLDLTKTPSTIGIWCNSPQGAIVKGEGECRWPQAAGGAWDRKLDIARCTFDPAHVAACAIQPRYPVQTGYAAESKLQPKGIDILNDGGNCPKLNNSTSVSWPPEQPGASDHIVAKNFPDELVFRRGDSGGVALANVGGQRTIVGVNIQTGPEAIVVPTWVSKGCLWKNPPEC